MRESFVFYSSFFDAVEEAPAEDRWDIIKTIVNYQQTGVTPENLSGVKAIVFKLVRPQIDATLRRYENACKGAEHGIKGGRPKKELKINNEKLKTKEEDLAKLSENSRDPDENPEKPLEGFLKKPTQTLNVNDNVNDNVYENENENEKDNQKDNQNEKRDISDNIKKKVTETLHPSSLVFSQKRENKTKKPNNLLIQKPNSPKEQILIEKFRQAYPEKEIDCSLDPANLDMDLLITKISESEFLKSNHNITLSSCLKHYNKIIAGFYKTYKPPEVVKTAAASEFNRRFENIDFDTVFCSS